MSSREVEEHRKALPNGIGWIAIAALYTEGCATLGTAMVLDVGLEQ